MVEGFDGMLAQWFARGTFAGLFIILVSLDVVTGFVRAAKERRLSSKVSFPGIIRKIGELLLLVLVMAIEYWQGIAMVEYVAMALCLTEGLSIVENLGAMGVIIPRRLLVYFESLREHVADLDAKDEAARRDGKEDGK